MLPSGFIFLQRDWLSSNSLLLKQPESAYLFDSGYVTHAQLLVDFLKHQLGDQPLQVLINTHLHSDHCGGNALIQSTYENVQIWVPATQFNAVNAWDEDALSYQITGQLCTRFQATDAVSPNDSLQIHGLSWKAFSSKGHDNDSLIFFQPDHGLLLSADALWENGFGVVFPELEGEDAFAQVAATLDVIEQLSPQVVIPGHGPVFVDAPRAIDGARRRLDGFVRNPGKHALYAAKVLLKYKLLEWQQISLQDLAAWAQATPYFGMLRERHFADQAEVEWLGSLSDELVRSGAATRQGDMLHNA